VPGSDTECAEEADGIVGHVLEGVPPSRQMRRAARVAVVETDHAETFGGELTAKVLWPVNELEAETHDEQHCGMPAVAERLVAEVDVTNVCQPRRVVLYLNHRRARHIVDLSTIAALADGLVDGPEHNHNQTPAASSRI